MSTTEQSTYPGHSVRRGLVHGTIQPRLLGWVARLPFQARGGPLPGLRKALTRNWYELLSCLDRRVAWSS